MSIQNKVVGGLAAVAGATLGLSAVGSSKQEIAANKARKAMQDELSMKLTQEQLKGERLKNRISRLELRKLKGKEVAPNGKE